MASVGLLRRVDVEAGALAEIIVRLVGDVGAARAGVRSDQDQAELGADALVAAFLDDVGVGAGEAGEVPEDWEGSAGLRLGREVDPEGHVGAGLAAGVAAGELGAAEGSWRWRGFRGSSAVLRYAVRLR